MPASSSVREHAVNDWLDDLASRRRKAVHGIKEQFQMPGPNMTLDREPLLVRYDHSRPPADVILAPDAQHSLAPTWNWPAPDFSKIFVLLAEADGDDGKHVEIYINEHRLGTLTVADSAEFLMILATARVDGKPVVGQAIRDRDAYGRWALQIYRPEPS
jgi:hypothetical protein